MSVCRLERARFLLVDEISSRGREYQLPHDVLVELRNDDQFVDDLRRGVRMMVRSWGWVRAHPSHLHL